ncbi:MAG: nucleoside phosphorylase [Anaerolineae bacterium]|nr:nucleoside phosphorylase [Anaerolineae bacterium]
MSIKSADLPLQEFDFSRKAILEPRAGFETGGITRGVLCFFYDTLAALKEAGQLIVVGNLLSEIGPNPVYEFNYQGEKVLVLHPGVGAPLAAAFLEEFIALGVKDVIACGGCGVLDANIDAGHAMIAESAVRDEGLSYHYLPAGRETTAHPDAIIALENTLRRHHQPIQRVKCWTTDAIYRETINKCELRRSEGCKVVEMEAASFFAVAHFRGIRFGQILYGGDLVVPEGWDERDWFKRSSSRELLFNLAVEAVITLSNS